MNSPEYSCSQGHNWGLVFDTGFTKYLECKKCSKRRVVQRIFGEEHTKGRDWLARREEPPKARVTGRTCTHEKFSSGFKEVRVKMMGGRKIFGVKPIETPEQVISILVRYVYEWKNTSNFKMPIYIFNKRLLTSLPRFIYNNRVEKK